MNQPTDTFVGYNFGTTHNIPEAKKQIRYLLEKAKQGSFWAMMELRNVWGWDWDMDEPDQYKVTD